MASKITNPSLALFLLFNLIFFSHVSAWNKNYPPTPSRPKPPPPNKPNPQGQNCPVDALKLGVCAAVLGGLLNITVGDPPVKPCCSLIEGLVDLEAAVCLCIAIKANILGININLPIALSLLLNVCSRRVPEGFICPST